MDPIIEAIEAKRATQMADTMAYRHQVEATESTHAGHTFRVSFELEPVPAHKDGLHMIRGVCSTTGAGPRYFTLRFDPATKAADLRKELLGIVFPLAHHVSPDNSAAAMEVAVAITDMLNREVSAYIAGLVIADPEPDPAIVDLLDLWMETDTVNDHGQIVIAEDLR